MKNVRLIKLAFLSIMLLTTQAFASGNTGQQVYTEGENLGDYNLVLMGIVLNKSSNQPLHSVTVTLMETYSNKIHQTTTTMDGRFYFQLEKAKEYQLYASSENGFTGEVKTISTIGYEGDESNALNVILTLEEEYNTALYEITELPQYARASVGYELPRESILTFKIQVMTQKIVVSQVANDRLVGVQGPIETEKTEDRYRYMVGDYEDYQEAKRKLHQLMDDGFPEATMIPYLKGERLKLTAEEAIADYR